MFCRTPARNFRSINLYFLCVQQTPLSFSAASRKNYSKNFTRVASLEKKDQLLHHFKRKDKCVFNFKYGNVEVEVDTFYAIRKIPIIYSFIIYS